MGHLMADPLRDPEPLIRRVYAYVAYRVGDGPDAEDITSEVFARALRSRQTYNASKGSPITWLAAIARSVISENGRVPQSSWEASTEAAEGGVADGGAQRLDVRHAVQQLSPRDQELLSLRYGADLKVRDIARILEI